MLLHADTQRLQAERKGMLFASTTVLLAPVLRPNIACPLSATQTCQKHTQLLPAWEGRELRAGAGSQPCASCRAAAAQRHFVLELLSTASHCGATMLAGTAALAFDIQLAFCCAETH